MGPTFGKSCKMRDLCILACSRVHIEHARSSNSNSVATVMQIHALDGAIRAIFVLSHFLSYGHIFVLFIIFVGIGVSRRDHNRSIRLPKAFRSVVVPSSGDVFYKNYASKR